MVPVQNIRNMAECDIASMIGAQEIRTNRETAKTILENMDDILRELRTTVEAIQEAVYQGPKLTNKCGEGEPRCEAIVDIISRQRNTAEEILKAVVGIREALW